MQAPYREYLTQDLHFDDRVARVLLDRLGLPCPTLPPGEVHRLIEQALLGPASRYLSAPAQKFPTSRA
jgi:hypothetical protein